MENPLELGRAQTTARAQLFQTAVLPGRRGSRQGHSVRLAVRSALGLVNRGAVLQDIDEMTARTGYACVFASYDLFCLNRVAIYVFAGVVVRTHRGAFEGNSCKHAARARIAKDLSTHPGVGI